jgi:C1A family cysteine protease
MAKSLGKSSKKRVLNCLPSPTPQSDWHFESAAAVSIVSGTAAVPASVDLREHWWEIGDQGETGSCVGWAVGDSLIRWYLVKLNKINTNEHLSVRYLWMSAKETDEWTDRPTTFIELAGTSIKAALDIARKYGVVRDSELPFDYAKVYKKGQVDEFYGEASKLRIASYYSLIRKGEYEIDSSRICRWLAQKGPIAIRLGVDQEFRGANIAHPNLDHHRPEEVADGGYHAAALVGYFRDSKKKLRFIIRNSWGKNWGKDGFAFASEAYARSAFEEAYGIYAY